MKENIEELCDDVCVPDADWMEIVKEMTQFALSLHDSR